MTITPYPEPFRCSPLPTVTLEQPRTSRAQNEYRATAATGDTPIVQPRGPPAGSAEVTQVPAASAIRSRPR